ncbi:hypothetical protein [Stutzerimonas kunmingensis]|uniref:hypothetical protein n=1 Tax=Stutzerimonas kunmingensis TaxID=1211807 RepID=UPI00289ED5BC|nr:hypothetical protein [Stutzerimonas kunmingensis]
MKPTDIRSKQPIRIDDNELLMVIGAALGGTVSISEEGAVDIQPWESVEHEPLCLTFKSMFDGRKFADLQSLASVVIDMQIEQLEMDQRDAARYRWLRDPSRNSDKGRDDMGEVGAVGLVYVSTGNGSSEAVEAEEMDQALDTAIEAAGVTVRG